MGNSMDSECDSVEFKLQVNRVNDIGNFNSAF
jgi:hypothetical protein